MTIEVHGHVAAIRQGQIGRLVVTVNLEMDRAHGQCLEISLTPEEARTWMPGTGITLMLYPNALKPCPAAFASSESTQGRAEP